LAEESEDDDLPTKSTRARFTSQFPLRASTISDIERKTVAPGSSDSDDGRVGFGQPRDTPACHPRTPCRSYVEAEYSDDEEHDSDMIPVSETGDDSRAKVTQLLIPRYGKFHSASGTRVLTSPLGAYSSQGSRSDNEEEEYSDDNTKHRDDEEGEDSDDNNNGSRRGLVIQGAFGSHTPRAFSLPPSSPPKHRTHSRKQVAGQKRGRSPAHDANVCLLWTCLLFN